MVRINYLTSLELTAAPAKRIHFLFVLWTKRNGVGEVALLRQMVIEDLKEEALIQLDLTNLQLILDEMKHEILEVYIKIERTEEEMAKKKMMFALRFNRMEVPTWLYLANRRKQFAVLKFLPQTEIAYPEKHSCYKMK